MSQLMKKWRLFILPKPVYARDNYDGIFRLVLKGTLALSFVLFTLLLVGYFVQHHTYVLNSLLIGAGALLYLGIVYWFWYKVKKKYLASQLLIYFYAVVSTIIIVTWGLNTPVGILLLAISIILTSILIGSQYTLHATLVAIIILFGLQIAISFGGYRPHETPSLELSTFGDALADGVLLMILGMLSWLFGRQTERAEAALLHEKQQLEVRVEERTRQLQTVQMQEMQNLYRFAEIGQLSTALVHDLANQISVLSFDIEDLNQDKRATAVKRARQSITQLEKTIAAIRTQLKGKSRSERTTINDTIAESIHILKPTAKSAHVDLVFKEETKKISSFHDPNRLGHIMSILITNAIDAYKESKAKTKRQIIVTVKVHNSTITATVQDWAGGIPTPQRAKLFEPFYTTKESGMGIGLFLARQLAETHFKGRLELDPQEKSTKFILDFPQKSYD